MKSLFSLSITLCISGCAFHSGMMTANPEYIKPEYELKTTVKANAKSTRIFGIGGLGKEALVAEAKSQLYLYYPLRNEEAYANVTVDFWNLYFPFYHRTKATVTADIIGKVNASEEDTTYQSLFRQKKAGAGRIGIFKVGDEVSVMNDNIPKKFKVFDIINDKKVLIGLPGGKSTFKARYSDLYLMEKDRLPDVEYKINDAVQAYTYLKWREAQIVGLNETKVIVEVTEGDLMGEYLELPYGNIKAPEE
ncbi:MAG: DUF6567 family protein [Cyclobacteriaceae bacterium]